MVLEPIQGEAGVVDPPAGYLQDVRRIESWGGGVDGPILDAGCGPGHWTAHLSALGHEACGVDPVPAFVQIARREHPGTEYRLGSFADLQ